MLELEMPIISAVTSIDGRYYSKIKKLSQFTSEAALIHYRIKVELLWLEHLLEMMKEKKLPNEIFFLEEDLEKLAILCKRNFHSSAEEVKAIEEKTNHDVKACEYYLQNLFDKEGLNPKLKPFIHFGCTSEDINNLAYGLMLKELREEIFIPTALLVEKSLESLVKKNIEVPLLSRTHGQPASPTSLGKELALFLYRLREQRKRLEKIPIFGKINGAVGNFNAHLFVYPEADWLDISKLFVEKKLDLTWNPFTTQIESHDGIALYFQNLSLTATISIGLCQDIWSYISTNIFGQKIIEGEVGSSTMPHKVNPIDFENAEGNFGVARSLLNHLAEKLPISRRQRDLSDSTVLRSIGTITGHFLLAQTSLLKGLSKIEAKKEVLDEELNEHWEIIAEPIQMLMRRYGITNAYERVKAYSRGKVLGKKEIKDFIQTLEEIPFEEKERLLLLSPNTYLGLAKELAEKILKDL